MFPIRILARTSRQGIEETPVPVGGKRIPQAGAFAMAVTAIDINRTAEPDAPGSQRVMWHGSRIRMAHHERWRSKATPSCSPPAAAAAPAMPPERRDIPVALVERLKCHARRHWPKAAPWLRNVAHCCAAVCSSCAAAHGPSAAGCKLCRLCGASEPSHNLSSDAWLHKR